MEGWLRPTYDRYINWGKRTLRFCPGKRVERSRDERKWQLTPTSDISEILVEIGRCLRLPPLNKRPLNPLFDELGEGDSSKANK